MLPTFDHAIAAIQQQGPPQERWSEFCNRLCAGLDAPVLAALISRYREEDIKELRQVVIAGAPVGLKSLGIYLGLDTPNTNLGKNLEIGFRPSATLDDPYAEWVFDGLDYLDDYVIQGLADMTGFYSDLKDEELSHSLDYAVPFAYGALIAGEAFKEWDQSDSLAVGFGFHDGDLLRLVSKKGNLIKFNCQFDFQGE